jgi:hypothetical protein
MGTIESLEEEDESLISIDLKNQMRIYMIDLYNKYWKMIELNRGWAC